MQIFCENVFRSLHSLCSVEMTKGAVTTSTSVTRHCSNKLGTSLAAPKVHLLLRMKKFYYHIHIAHFITRDFAHHELTQDSIDSRIFYCIAISKRQQPCLHPLYRMNITLQDLLLQRLRQYYITK